MTFTPKMREYLNNRGISDESIEQYGLYQSGLFNDGPFIHIPVEGMERVYNPNPPEGEPKIKWLEGSNNAVIPPFPSWEAFKDADILCEGEFDCIVLRQHGYKAATGTAGVSGWRDEWLRTLNPKTLYRLAFDHDEAGLLGAIGGINSKGTRITGLAERLNALGINCKIVHWPQDKPKGYDVTDYFKEGGTTAGFDALLDEATPFTPTPDVPTPEVPLLVLHDDPSSEQAVIGGIVMGGSDTFVQVNAILRVSDFRNAQYRFAYEVMTSLYNRGEVITFLTVVSEADSISLTRSEQKSNLGPYLVDAMTQVHTQLDAIPAAKRIRLLSTKRRLLGVAQSLSAIAYGTGGHKTEESLVSAVQNEFETLLEQHASGVHIITPDQGALDYADVLFKREKHDPEFIGIPTGFKPLDEFVAYRKGEFWLVAGAPAVGKTTVLRNLQDSLAERGFPSLLASVEQPAIQLWDRSIAADARIDSWRIARAMLNQTEWKKVWDSIGKRSKEPAYIYENGSMTTAMLAAALHLAVIKYHVKVCFVDYLQILADEDGDNEVQRVGKISRRLAQLARSLNICIVAASQLSRAYSKRPKGSLPELTDLRETGQLEQDAFVVLGVARDAEQARTQAQIGILKNRNGESGMSFQVRFDPEYTRFVFEGDS